jgi:hypothetical protein
LNELTEKGGLKNKNIYESPTFSDLSNNQLKNNENENFDELLNIKFPINNKTFSYMIIDANLALKENLQNIFLIEFDLTNNKDNKDNSEFIKLLRDINHPDREIFFVLSGTIHGIKMFTSELKFSVEQKNFIKSIQYKMQTYKKDIIEQKIQLKNDVDKLKLRNTFFAKVLSNTNIGIEFSKPHFDMRNAEKFQTNFNSIVNSKIKINKIFLEVSIPKSFLLTNNYLTIIDDKIEENESQIKDIQLDKFNDKNANETTAFTSHDNSNINGGSNINNNTGFNSPTLSGIDNNMNFENNIYSKSSLRNKQLNIPSLNRNFNLNLLNEKEHIYNSPHLGYSYPKFVHQQSMMTPDNFSFFFGGGGKSINNINNSTFSSSFHFHPAFGNNNFQPVSPGGRSSFENNTKMMFNNFYNNSIYSRLSENSLFSEGCNNNNYNINSPRSVINYPSNYYNNGFINNNLNLMNNQSQLSVRSIGKGIYFANNIFNNMNNLSINLNTNQGYKSPRNVSNLNFTNFNISEEKKFVSNVSTIKKKISDLEKSNYIKKNLANESNNSNSEQKVDGKITDRIDTFIEHYEGVCNFLIFVKKSTPYLNKKYIKNIQEMNLEKLFKSFQKVSLIGLKIDFLSNYEKTKNKNILNISYFLTLSSFEIIFTTKDIILKIIDTLILLNKCSPQLKTKIEENFTCTYNQDQIINLNNINNIISNNNYIIEMYPNNNNALKITLRSYNQLIIEYKESKPPHLRKHFYQQMKEILNLLFLNNISINNISTNSYFSIRYTPVNCRNKNNIQTSFINYHKFSFNEERNNSNNKYIEVPVVGMLPLKLNQKFFLEKINKEYYCNNNIYDYITINGYIQEVTNNILQNGNGSCLDVEYYMNQ